jgi:hypothetical protein
MPVHIVKQGDCMSSIADQYGFFWETLWNHERNADLKQRRKNPNVLMAGDHVFIPELRPKEESGETTKVHTFRLRGVPARLNFRMKDALGEARAGLRYTLTVDGQRFTGTTGDDGLISQVISPRAKKAELKLDNGEEYRFDLGHMNPMDYTSGVQARLKNLGYYRGDIDGSMSDALREAIRRFQGDRNLEVTGEPDAATRDAMSAAHES